MLEKTSCGLMHTECMRADQQSAGRPGRRQRSHCHTDTYLHNIVCCQSSDGEQVVICRKPTSTLPSVPECVCLFRPPLPVTPLDRWHPLAL